MFHVCFCSHSSSALRNIFYSLASSLKHKCYYIEMVAVESSDFTFRLSCLFLPTLLALRKVFSHLPSYATTSTELSLAVSGPLQASALSARTTSGRLLRKEAILKQRTCRLFLCFPPFRVEFSAASLLVPASVLFPSFQVDFSATRLCICCKFPASSCDLPARVFK